MRLTHYEDGSLCGERFCINLIRHLFHLQASLWSFAPQSSGTFSAVNIIQLYFENVLTPSPVSGKVKVKPPPIIRRNTITHRFTISLHLYKQFHIIYTKSKRTSIGRPFCSLTFDFRRKSNISLVRRTNITRPQVEYHSRKAGISLPKAISLPGAAA